MPRGEYKLLLFLAVSQILKHFMALEERRLNEITIRHTPNLVSSGKMSHRVSRSLGLLFNCPVKFYFDIEDATEFSKCLYKKKNNQSFEKYSSY